MAYIQYQAFRHAVWVPGHVLRSGITNVTRGLPLRKLVTCYLTEHTEEPPGGCCIYMKASRLRIKRQWTKVKEWMIQMPYGTKNFYPHRSGSSFIIHIQREKNHPGKLQSATIACLPLGQSRWSVTFRALITPYMVSCHYYYLMLPSLHMLLSFVGRH